MIDSERQHVVVDEAADLLAVEGNVERVALSVPAARPDLHHAKELRVAIEWQ